MPGRKMGEAAGSGFWSTRDMTMRGRAGVRRARVMLPVSHFPTRLPADGTILCLATIDPHFPSFSATPTPSMPRACSRVEPVIAAREALERLREGNHRFASDIGGTGAVLSRSWPSELPTKQEPFAIVLGCADARVPAEIVFDQGLGGLFVIRVAGNIVAPSQVDSVEFAASRFGTRLVVVLGHSQCGAILATLEELQQPAKNQSRNLRSIVERVRPSVEPLLQTDLRHDLDLLVGRAVRANVRASADHLRHGSEVLEQMIRSDGLLVVGAEYSLESGLVEFFDGMDRG